MTYRRYTIDLKTNKITKFVHLISNGVKYLRERINMNNNITHLRIRFIHQHFINEINKFVTFIKILTTNNHSHY